MFTYAETLYELASMRQRELIIEAEQQRLLRAARIRPGGRERRSRGARADRSPGRDRGETPAAMRQGQGE